MVSYVAKITDKYQMILLKGHVYYRLIQLKILKIID